MTLVSKPGGGGVVVAHSSGRIEVFTVDDGLCVAADSFWPQ